MTQTLYELRNKLERMRLEQIDLAEQRRRSGGTPSAQHEAYCVAKGLKLAIEKVNELIAGDVKLERQANREDLYQEVITELKRYNKLHNDLDAYLFQLCEYALGQDEKPIKEDFGL